MRGNKFFAKATVCIHGHKHASKREAARCVQLHLHQKAGLISDLVVEPQFFFEIDGKPLKHKNGRRAGYKPDFAYTSHGGRKIVEDVKSPYTMTEAATLRMTLFRALFPEFELEVVQ